MSDHDEAGRYRHQPRIARQSFAVDAENRRGGGAGRAEHRQKPSGEPGGSATRGHEPETTKPEEEDEARLTKRQRRRRRKGRKKSGAVAAAPAQTETSGPAATPRGARKYRRGRRSDSPAGDAPPQNRPEAPGVAGKAVSYAGQKSARTSPADPKAEARRDANPAPVYAALDLGTNNCRLLIAVPTRPGQFRVIDAFSRIVRLGEGLGRTGSLSRGAMDRAAAALAVCAQKISAREVDRSWLIATEACRAAANGAEFIEEVAERTGLSLDIVPRETEARLAVSGCGSLIDRKARGAVLFDIGGGSTEIALLDLRGPYTRRLASRIVAWTSLPVGVVTLAERHGGRNVTPEIFETMVAETVAMIEAFPGRDKLADLVGTENFHLLGTSGTVTTLAGVHLGLERYDRRQVDGLWLTSEESDALVQKIAGWSFEARVANPCIGSDRADLVLAGCAIFEAIRRVWPAPSLRVADRGLREGILTEMMVADGVWRRRDGRRAS
ncbi:Ppx/GppA phosphatase family protein [Jiella avicenniae]|uniref:Ppx/GppA family phosphatase n=1 Tax=Jiella avicenniae TaxID=2907202 RepID=A0A9X1P1A0_9HYPH|nr:Ppx/GppA family phosphatase [Jiella avicenniae]